MVNFLTLPLFKDIALPFLLVFALIFAILEKSKLLGDDKHQINAIIGFVIAGLFISFYNYVTMLQQFMIFLVISLIIIFVFMLFYGFVAGTKDGDIFKEQKWLKLGLGIIFFIALVVATLIITNTWGTVKDFFTSGTVGTNIIFGIIIIVAIAAVLFGGKKRE
jgi:peptidoglycan/LPS O-acetylase OafA/YrhL